MSEASTISEWHPSNQAEGLANLQPTKLVHGSVIIAGAREPVPYTAEIPQRELAAEDLVILPPGLGAIKRHSRLLRYALAAEQGLITVSYDPPRKRSKESSYLERLVNPQQLHEDTIAEIITHIGSNIDMRRTTHGEAAVGAPLSFVPHSMGELPAVAFAVKNPASVKSLVRIETVGTEGALGLKLIPRTVQEVCLDIAPAVMAGRFGRSPVVAWREFKYFASDPIRTFGEIISCLTADTRPFTEALSAAGVYLAYIGGTRDYFFHPADTLAAAGDYLDYYEELDMGHIGPQTKQRLVAAAVGNAVINQPRN